jgi:hypothetical protein
MISSNERIPDWLLERLSAGELPEKQAQALRQRLCQQGEECRLTALATSNTEILAAFPPERIVPEIERRVAASECKATRKASRHVRPFWALSLATACATAVVVLLAVRKPTNVGKPWQDLIADPSPGYNGIKGEPWMRIYRKTKSGEERLQAGKSVRNGDILQIRYYAGVKSYGVIASIDARGIVTFHLPENANQAATLVQRGAQALAHSYELDDSPGFERFIFVTSDKLFTTEVVTQALQTGNPLPAPLSKLEITLKKE